MGVSLAALVVLAAAPLWADEAPALVTLRGRVVDARTGEPIAKAAVSLRDQAVAKAVTDAGGHFVLSDVPPGEGELIVTTVGYGVTRKVVHAGPETGELEIRLSQEALRRSEDVAVVASPFEPADPAAPVGHELAGTDLKNLGNVLVDDPLRSVQSMPGIAASDDFGATFAARGAGFGNVGFYIDGVLMDAPFHTIRDVNDGFSLTLVNGDVVESLSLFTGAAPARYGDRTGPVLALKTRDGSRDGFFGRASLGATGLYATLEGPLGAARRTSWLVSARKSYLDYVLARLDESGIVLGYHDATARLTHQADRAHTVSLGLLYGRSRWRSTEDDLQPQSAQTADAGTNLGTLTWRWIPSQAAWLDTVAFFAREAGLNRALDGTERFRSASDQWGLRTDGIHLRGRHRIAAGVLVRSLAEDATARAFDGAARAYRVTEDYDAASGQAGGYLQETWTGAGDRVSVTAGLRLDHFARTGETRVLPRGAFTLGLSGSTRLLGGYGEYAQFPGFEELLGRNGNPDLEAERAAHYSLALEQGLFGNVRVRVEAYDEELRGVFFTPGAEWRRQGQRIIPPVAPGRLHNALSGHSRGVEVLLQRRTANGLSGWIAYGLGRARRHEEGGPAFDADFDQRHTLTVFASYRVSSTLNLSTKYRYGSGFPVVGYYEERPDGLFLAEARNGYRPEAYSRWDVRANKAFLFRAFKLTVYAEVINLLDRTHNRYTGLDGLNTRTGRVFLDQDTLFPLLPSAGVMVEF
jgi:hypothetical protein